MARHSPQLGFAQQPPWLSRALESERSSSARRPAPQEQFLDHQRELVQEPAEVPNRPRRPSPRAARAQSKSVLQACLGQGRPVPHRLTRQDPVATLLRWRCPGGIQGCAHGDRGRNGRGSDVHGVRRHFLRWGRPLQGCRYPEPRQSGLAIRRSMARQKLHPDDAQHVRGDLHRHVHGGPRGLDALDELRCFRR